MSVLRVYLGVARARFLLLALFCCLLALVLALPARALDVHLLLDGILLALAGMAAHASVNALNEYCDFRSGLDLITERTPFSGGSGTLPASPGSAPVALWGGIASLLLCFLLGLHFVVDQPQAWPGMLALGLLGAVLIVVYTPWLTRMPWLCLPAPGVGFGLLMLPAGVLALGGELHGGVWSAGVVVACLCNNLLLVNQLPDVDADRCSGRRTLAMLLGQAGVRRLVLWQWLLGLVVLGLAILAGWLPWSVLLVLAGLPLARQVWLGALPASGGLELAAMAANAALAVLAPLVLALGVLIGS